jgi:predicted tellurium resistance membrane protein TerC
VALSIAQSFGLRLLAIAGINLVLSADNALIIALAVERAPRSQRTRIMIGSAICAIIFQTAATFFASELLSFKFVRLLGGIAVLAISLNLCRRAPEPPRLAGGGAHLGGGRPSGSSSRQISACRPTIRWQSPRPLTVTRRC